MILLFIEFNQLILFILKIIISIIMTLVAFGKKNTLTNTLYLYMNSVILAGALYYLTIEFSYKRDNLVFFKNEFYINYILILLMAPVVMFIYYNHIKLLKEKLNLNHEIIIKIKDRKETIKLSGFIDSGNKLKDPMTKKYIIIINKNIYEGKNPIYVPYHGVNKEGLIKCYTVEYIEINKQKFKNYMLGISDNEINLNGSDCILNYKLMEDLNV